MTISTFKYNNRLYTPVTPSKQLFKSTMVHDVVTRGSVFAVDVDSGTLTILPPDALQQVKQEWHLIETLESTKIQAGLKDKAVQARKRLEEIKTEIKELLETIGETQTSLW